MRIGQIKCIIVANVKCGFVQGAFTRAGFSARGIGYVQSVILKFHR